MRRLSRTPQISRLFSMNLGTGSRASSMNARLDALLLKSMSRLAREMRTGWATRLPVMTEMLVLSEEMTAPSSVAPSGI